MKKKIIITKKQQEIIKKLHEEKIIYWDSRKETTIPLMALTRKGICEIHEYIDSQDLEGVYWTLKEGIEPTSKLFLYIVI